MLGIERRQRIMELLQQDHKVYVGELSRSFRVTEETIRRDLEKLEKEDLLSRSYGGAVLKEHTMDDVSFIKRTSLHNENKECIAQKAEVLINDGDTMMIDASTTCLELLKHFRQKKKLTIITNSVRLVNEFVDAPFSIISTGGTLRSHSYALIGDAACSFLQNYFVDFAIISCKAIDREKGIMESNEPESSIKKQMIAQARKCILLVDHSKFDKTAFKKTGDFSAIDYVVTDREPTSEWIEFFADKKIRLIY